MRGNRWLPVVLTAVGVAGIAYGLVGILGHRDATRPANLFGWFGAAGVTHDAILAPLSVAVGLATARLVPAVALPSVRVGLAFSGVLFAFTWPYVHGYGYRASNPSALPLDYSRNLLWALVVIWTAVAVRVVWRVVVARR